jgi:hypothetical protein
MTNGIFDRDPEPKATPSRGSMDFSLECACVALGADLSAVTSQPQ